MPEGARRPALLLPSRWPVRWRLAAVSAGLTFAILLVFATVVGRLAENRLEDDFRSELDARASELAFRIQLDPVTGEPGLNRSDAELLSSDATIAVVTIDGRPVVRPVNPRPLPAPRAGLESFGDLHVATRPLVATAGLIDAPRFYVQYARDHDKLDATISRLWLFLAIGVLGGTLMATLAGLWIARRAMGPIADLTARAREIATTRDPSLQMPMPAADDEVAELARTLDSMLAELDAARGEAQGMVHAQREFVADASHELRTPLTSILANLELLQERLGAGEEGEMVESALRSSRRMRRLVADLLLLARADAGRVGRRRPCDLAEIAAAAVAEIRPLAGDHRLELHHGEAVTVSGNADELHRLTINLLENAVRHTPPGTSVEVAVSRHDASAVLKVTDDGPGLPAEMGDQVFSRFVRGGGPADVALDSGTGLGLAIVHAVASSHGGTVTPGAGPSGGARFEVTLPALETPAEPPSKISANV